MQSVISDLMIFAIFGERMRLREIDSIPTKMKGEREEEEKRIYFWFQAKQFGGSCSVIDFRKCEKPPPVMF